MKFKKREKREEGSTYIYRFVLNNRYFVTRIRVFFQTSIQLFEMDFNNFVNNFIFLFLDSMITDQDEYRIII